MRWDGNLPGISTHNSYDLSKSDSQIEKNLEESRPIIPHTLLLCLSESLIGLSLCLVIFSKIIPKVYENLDVPRLGSAFLGTGMPPYVSGNVHEIIEMFQCHLNQLLGPFLPQAPISGQIFILGSFGVLWGHL